MVTPTATPTATLKTTLTPRPRPRLTPRRSGNQQLAYANSETRPSTTKQCPTRPSRALPGQILKAMKSRPSKEITVVIVEDHLMFREQLVRLINEVDDMRVCGEADNIRDGFALIKQARPSIAIVDISLEGSSGLELLKNLRAYGVAVPALVLSMHDESLYAERALRAGARGYVNKNEASAELMRAIRQVLNGEIYLNTSFMSRMINGMINGRDSGTRTRPIDRLADRELEVFDLVGRGLTTREIAAQLCLGITTVDTYRARIKEKLNLENCARLRVEASRWVQLRE
jgi:DNA-binding NarL/FixJ family response regulator